MVMVRSFPFPIKKRTVRRWRQPKGRTQPEGAKFGSLLQSDFLYLCAQCSYECTWKSVVVNCTLVNDFMSYMHYVSSTQVDKWVPAEVDNAIWTSGTSEKKCWVITRLHLLILSGETPPVIHDVLLLSCTTWYIGKSSYGIVWSCSVFQ